MADYAKVSPKEVSHFNFVPLEVTGRRALVFLQYYFMTYMDGCFSHARDAPFDKELFCIFPE